MKTITVRLKNDKKTELLTSLLNALNFVESVEVNEEDEELSEEEISMVEERWAEYKKNPKIGIPGSEVRSKIKKKHGI